jgi:hypothetical protein
MFPLRLFVVMERVRQFANVALQQDARFSWEASFVARRRNLVVDSVLNPQPGSADSPRKGHKMCMMEVF